MISNHEPLAFKISGVRDGKVYNDAVSKDVEKYVLFVAGNMYDGVYAYKDQACTEKVSYDEMFNMFLKGVVLITGWDDENDDYDEIECHIPIKFVNEKRFDTKGKPITWGRLEFYTFDDVYSKEYIPEVNE